MSTEIAGIRAQILANAKIVLRTTNPNAQTNLASPTHQTNPTTAGGPSNTNPNTPNTAYPLFSPTVSQLGTYNYHAAHPSTSGNTLNSPTPSASASTLINPTNHAHVSALGNSAALDVVVFGTTNDYTAAVLLGLTPAIEGSAAKTPQAALEKLLGASCELLKLYIPKVGIHQRNIHGGGVFDDDMISLEFMEAGKNGGSTA